MPWSGSGASPFFSKQAVCQLGDTTVTLLDTPGHVDFSAEMERTLQVLDYAVLVINGADGVQGHTETLWSLLKRYQVPTFLFINKMDQPGTDREALLSELQKRLSESCVDFALLDDADAEVPEEVWETIAMSDEELLERYLESGSIAEKDIRRLIRQRKLFPCYFGSALKLQGVEELLAGLERWMSEEMFAGTEGWHVVQQERADAGARNAQRPVHPTQHLAQRFSKSPGRTGQPPDPPENYIRQSEGQRFFTGKRQGTGEGESDPYLFRYKI